MNEHDARWALRRSAELIDRSAELSRRQAARRTRRFRTRASFIIQSAVAAAVAYALARHVFNVPVPLFAPVAAILTLGMSFGQRISRAVEVTVGVAVGALVGELFIETVGMGTWQVAAIVALSMSIASFLGAGALLVNQAGIQGLIIALLAGHSTTPLGRWTEALIGALTGLLFATLTPSSVLLQPRGRTSTFMESLARMLMTSAHGLRHHDRGEVEEALDDARSTEVELASLRGYAADSVDIARYTPWHRRRRSNMQKLADQMVPLDRAVRNVRVLLRRAAIIVQMDEKVPDEYIDFIWELALITDDIGHTLTTNSDAEDVKGRLWNLARRSAASAPGVQLSAEVIRAQVRSILVDYYMMLGDDSRTAQATVTAADEQYRAGAMESVTGVLTTIGQSSEHTDSPQPMSPPPDPADATDAAGPADAAGPHTLPPAT